MSVDNTLCWVDIPVRDLDRSIAFYSKVMGKPVKKESFPGTEFGLLPHEERNASGCLVVCSDNAPSQTGPLIYLNVHGRLDAATAAATGNGGKLLEAKHPLGPHGFRVVILDSEGNRIALHSMVE